MKTSPPKAWLRQCRSLLEEPFHNEIDQDELLAKAPDWVVKIFDTLNANADRVMKKHVTGGLSARSLGAIAGHMSAIFEIKLPIARAKTKELKPLAKGLNSFRPEFKKNRILVKKKLREVNAIVANQDVRSQIEFGDAFKATYFNSLAEKNGLPHWQTDATKIHFMLLILWPYMPYIKSVHHLHQILRFLLPSQVVGDLKRIEKICQRINLSFRKKGRPKKEIQTRP